jgi:prolipoprotein diacylglyceryl transferase
MIAELLRPDTLVQFIPSPSQGVWHLGPIPVRGYALSIIAGIIAAIWIGERRWVARGGRPGEVSDVAVWAVPFGVVGGRIYHVITDNDRYFGEGGHPIEALYIWRGGLGIWGAIALGAVGVLIAVRLRGIKMLPMADAVAPGILVAHALGRWGNWFNQELFGKPTDLPWGLEIDADHRPPGYEDYPTFHPTFLYEFTWCVIGFAVVVWLDRRFRLGHGRVLALYVMTYTLGRGWIEMLRIDTVQLDNVLGLRLNVWTSIVLFLAATAYFAWATKRRPGREEQVYVEGRGPERDALSTQSAHASDQGDRHEPDQDDGERPGAQ